MGTWRVRGNDRRDGLWSRTYDCVAWERVQRLRPLILREDGARA